VRATLIHNAKAGDGSMDPDVLRDLLTHHGYEVDYRSSKDPDLATAVQCARGLLIAAGGDGTVSKVLKLSTPQSPPIAILPLGTANNIATSLGIKGTCSTLVEGWKDAKHTPFDIGSATSSDGKRHLIEGMGIGAIAAAMRAMDEIEGPAKKQLKRARQAIIDSIETAKVREIEFTIDGKRRAVEALFLEISNIRYIGPNLNLVPTALSGDGRFELIYAKPAQRENLVEWLRRGNHHELPPVYCLNGETVTVHTASKWMRIDDDLDVSSEALPMTVHIEKGARQILVPDHARAAA